MGPDKQQYDPQVYKRLELVRKQFQNSTAEKKRQESAERKERRRSYFAQINTYLPRILVYAFLAAMVGAIIWVLVTSTR